LVIKTAEAFNLVFLYGRVEFRNSAGLNAGTKRPLEAAGAAGTTVTALDQP
jgi:hypothetical protein